MQKKNLRNMIGYGIDGKKISWPNNAKLALQIVLNYEEGGESCILNGDKYSETFLLGCFWYSLQYAIYSVAWLPSHLLLIS